MRNVLHCLAVCLAIVFGAISCICDASTTECSGNVGLESKHNDTQLKQLNLPHLESIKTVSPTEIFVNESGYKPEEATVTLRVWGAGDPVQVHVPVDVVLAIDTSGSMNETAGYNDTKLNSSKTAACGFIDLLSFEQNINTSDRVAVVQFDSSLFNPETLLTGFTSNKSQIKDKLDSMSPGAEAPLYDSIGYSVDYANNNHYPPNQTHPHANVPNHHVPVVIVLTDSQDTCSNVYNKTSLMKFLSESHDSPPPVQNIGYETMVFTVGLGDETDASTLQQVANVSGGKYFNASDEVSLCEAFQNISEAFPFHFIVDTAAVKPPLTFMILEALSPYVLLVDGSMHPTANNTAVINGFYGGQGVLDDLFWDVPMMRIGDVFEVQYNITCSRAGTVGVGVNQSDAKNIYGSNWCKVIYKNYRYFLTADPNDIWTNDTNDCIITFNPPPVPERSIVLLIPMAGLIVTTAVIIVLSRKTPT